MSIAGAGPEIFHLSWNHNADAGPHQAQQPTPQAVYGVSAKAAANAPQRQVVQVGHLAASALRYDCADFLCTGQEIGYLC